MEIIVKVAVDRVCPRFLTQSSQTVISDRLNMAAEAILVCLGLEKEYEVMNMALMGGKKTSFMVTSIDQLDGGYIEAYVNIVRKH